MSGSVESMMVVSSSFLCFMLMFNILMFRAWFVLGFGSFAVRFGDDVANGGPMGYELSVELSDSWADELDDDPDSERAL